MSRDEAVREAGRRWLHPFAVDDLEGPKRFCVGEINTSNKWIWRGKGTSFEAAFADADRLASGGDV